MRENIAETERVRILKQHADEILELRDRAKRVLNELLAHEVRVMTMDGMPPRAAEQAARGNLAIRFRDLQAELEEMLAYHGERLRERLERLREDAEEE
jgi:hypothetical protein